MKREVEDIPRSVDLMNFEYSTGQQIPELPYERWTKRQAFLSSLRAVTYRHADRWLGGEPVISTPSVALVMLVVPVALGGRSLHPAEC